MSMAHPTFRVPRDPWPNWPPVWKPPESLEDVLRDGMPHRHLPAPVRRWRAQNARRLLSGVARWKIAQRLGPFTLLGTWHVDVVDPDGVITPYGLGSLQVVTTVGAEYLAGAFTGTRNLGNLGYLGFGKNAGAADPADTLLGAEELVTATGVRPTTTATNPSTNSVRWAGVSLYTGIPNITVREIGVFDAAPFNTGVMFDRAVIGGVPITTNYGLSLSFTLVLTAGGD